MREAEDQLKVIPQFCFPDAKDWAPVDNFPRSVQVCWLPRPLGHKKKVKENRDRGISWQSGHSLCVFLANKYLLEKKLTAQNRNDLVACKMTVHSLIIRLWQ